MVCGLEWGYVGGMQSISILEAARDFPALIERVQDGEEIIITRDGEAIAKLSPSTSGAPSQRGPITTEQLAWLEAGAATPLRPILEDAGEAVSRIRDEDWPR